LADDLISLSYGAAPGGPLGALGEGVGSTGIGAYCFALAWERNVSVALIRHIPFSLVKGIDRHIMG